MFLYRRYILLLFVVFAITISFFIGSGGKNLLLISVMSLSPIFFCFHRIKWDRTVSAFFLFIGFLIISSCINYSHFRFSSFIYTILFVLSFILLRDAIKRNYFSVHQFIVILRVLILLYAVVLLVQQFCVLFNKIFKTIIANRQE